MKDVCWIRCKTPGHEHATPVVTTEPSAKSSGEPTPNPAPNPPPFSGRIGIVQPGEMGAAIGDQLNGALWASAGRSDATVERANAAGMVDCGNLRTLVDQADLIVSVCPPHAALTVATEISLLGFDGLYLDANAVAPSTTRQIAELFEHVVDGGIIGPPPRRPGTTRLYLAGPDAALAASPWIDSNLDAVVVGESIGAASAVKMAYAAWTKGSAALLVNVLALAQAEGVGDDLQSEWELSQPELLDRSRNIATVVGQRAWRWAGEMDEIASSFQACELPDGFHETAADLYRQLNGFKDAGDVTIDELIATLLS